MNDPQGVSIAFDSAWDADPTWTRIDDVNGTHVVSGWKTDRGRSGELDRTKVGTAEVDIIDPSGSFDPTNASGPYYGNLDPIKHLGIGLRNPFTDTYTQVYDGFTGELELELDEAENRFEGKWDAADAFDIFAALELIPAGIVGDVPGHGVSPPVGTETQVYYSSDQAVDDRIREILTDGGWPDAWRIIFSGNVNLQGSVYANRDQLMTAILDAADAEFPGVANFFMGKQGYAVFHGRFARFNPGDYVANGINTWLAGDRAAVDADDTLQTAQISRLKMRRSKNDIINAVQSFPRNIQDVNILLSLIADPTSIAKYGMRSLSFSDLMTLRGTTTGYKGFAETQLFSNYYVDNYANPHTRVSMLTFRTPRPSVASAPATWALICGVEIGDVVELFTTHPGGGGFAEGYYVEGIRYDVKPLGLSDTGYPDVTMELDLSPVALYDTDPFPGGGGG